MSWPAKHDARRLRVSSGAAISLDGLRHTRLTCTGLGRLRG